MAIGRSGNRGNRASDGHTPRAWGGILGLLLALAACTHGGGEPALSPEELLPPPDDPTYVQQVLQRRAEHLRAVNTAQLGLMNLRYLLDIRESSGATGRTGVGGDTSGLQAMRMEKEFDLMRAEGALTRLERRVRQDHSGALPPWWPRD